MRCSVGFSVLFCILSSYMTLSLIQAEAEPEPRRAFFHNSDSDPNPYSYNSILRRSLSSSSNSNGKKMIVTNAILDDDGADEESTNNITETEDFEPDGNDTSLNSKANASVPISQTPVIKKPQSNSSTNKESNDIIDKIDPPLVTVIPDSEIKDLNNKNSSKLEQSTSTSAHAKPMESESKSEPILQPTSLISNLLNQPQLFMDVLNVKFER